MLARQNVRQKEIEQNVWRRNHVSLDISKVLLYLYQECLAKVFFLNVQRNPKMSGKGPMVRWTKCPTKFKNISHTLN